MQAGKSMKRFTVLRYSPIIGRNVVIGEYKGRKYAEKYAKPEDVIIDNQQKGDGYSYE